MMLERKSMFALVTHLQDVYGIKLANDPDSRGYYVFLGKNDERLCSVNKEDFFDGDGMCFEDDLP